MTGVEKNAINGIGDAMGEYGYPKVAARGEIQGCEKGTIDDVLGHTGDSLIVMCQPENCGGEEERDEKTAPDGAEHFCYSIKNVASPDQLFAEGGKAPCESECEGERTRVMVKLVECAEIGWLVKQMDEDGLGYKEFESLHSATGDDGHQEGPRPVRGSCHSNLTPGHIAKAERNPAEYEEVRCLAEDDDVTPAMDVGPEKERDDQGLDKESPGPACWRSKIDGREFGFLHTHKQYMATRVNWITSRARVL
jgi:hypothetical protein